MPFSNINERCNQKRTLFKRFQKAIVACFENSTINLSKHKIQYFINDEDAKCEVKKYLTFQDFYDMIVQISEFGSKTNVIYDVYSQCVSQWFNSFSQRLVKNFESNCSKQSIKDDDTKLINTAEILIQFWTNFQHNVLPFIVSAFMYVERIRQKTSNKMMIQELTSYLFVKNVFQDTPIIVDHITQFLIKFFISKHQQIYIYLVQNYDVIDNTKFNLDEFILSIMDRQSFVIIDLLQMLIILGNDSYIHYKIFTIPFFERHLPEFLSQLSNILIQSMSMIDYLKFASKYLHLQSSFFNYIGEYQLNMFSSYFLFTKQIKKIIMNKKTGFKLMMDKKYYTSMSQLYLIIFTISNNTDEKSLIDGFRNFIQQYLDNRLKDLRSRYNCCQRNEAIEFVQTLLEECDHWNLVLNNVFQPKNIEISSLINKFYFDLLKVNSHVEQSIAYFMHELLCKDSEIIFGTKTKEYKRFEWLHKVFNLIPFIGDVNQFYDYTKHYFSTRLLLGLSMLPLKDEMHQLDEMNSRIRFNFLNNQNDNRQEFNIVYFNQNLNDFHNIVSNFESSNSFFLKLFVSKPQKLYHRNFLESFYVLNPGFWKLSEYEHCWMSTRMIKSYKDFEKIYLKQYKHRHLFINTKYSRAHVSMFFEDKKEVILIMNLNQFAIVNQFNHEDRVTNEMLFQRTKFQIEYNLLNALLSLIFCGLIRCASIGPNIEDFIFEINMENFPKLIEKNVISRNLFIYEQINFLVAKPLDQNMKKDFPTIVNVLTSGKDLSFLSSTSAVENLNLNKILNHLSVDSKRNRPLNLSRDITISESSLSSSSCSSRSLFKNELRSQTIQSVCSESPNGFEPFLKIEAAIVRVLKRNKQLPNLAAVYQGVKREMKKYTMTLKRRPSTPYGPDRSTNGSTISGRISVEDIQKSLLRLIEQNYVQRTDSGAFEYKID